jgi:hypothetical protein
MGLPYVADPAITRHLAAFLAKHLDGQTGPDAILFNGGVFQPPVLQERLVDVMRPWYQLPTGPWQPTVLDNPSLDLAVAWGAAYANWLRYSGGRRIGGGIARSYYVGVAAGTGEAASPETPADGDGQATILCLVPRRLAEGEEVVLDRPRMELALGEPVVFPLYTSTVRADDRPGDVLRVSPEQLLQLPPLTTVLRGGKRSAGVVKTVPVTLAAKCTEIGTLELACVSTDGNNRWRLEFNVREMVATVGTDAEERAPVADVLPEEQVQAAAGLIRSCYRGGDPAAAELTKAIEAALESPRGEWPMLLCRRMWEPLAEVSEDRRRSPAHLSRWYNLAGFCLRPGYGDPLDRFRMDQFWKLFNAPPKAPALTSAGSGQVTRTAAPPPAGGADHWIMWRRVAGGLNPAHQQALFERLRPVLVPGKSKPPARPGANELAEMWRCASSLERLDVRLKEQLGAALLATVRPGSTPPYAFWSLTRLGARVLLYGPLNAVVHPSVVAPWVEQLLAYTPADDNERAGWGFCLANLARRSGQRALDLDEELTARVAEALRGAGVSAEWVRMVEEVVEMEGDARSRLFGEALPIGLRLTGG